MSISPIPGGCIYYIVPILYGLRQTANKCMRGHTQTHRPEGATQPCLGGLYCSMVSLGQRSQNCVLQSSAPTLIKQT